MTQDDKPLSSNAGRDVFLTVYYYFPYVPPPPPEPVPAGSVSNDTLVPVTARLIPHPFVPPRQEETQVKLQRTLSSDGTLVEVLTPPANASSMRVEVRSIFS